jgi:hypothetical protein
MKDIYRAVLDLVLWAALAILAIMAIVDKVK